MLRKFDMLPFVSEHKVRSRGWRLQCHSKLFQSLFELLQKSFGAASRSLANRGATAATASDLQATTRAASTRQRRTTAGSLGIVGLLEKFQQRLVPSTVYHYSGFAADHCHLAAVATVSS